MALSTVVTTLIILVVSVLLAGVVSYFAINVTSTRVQEESLVLSYQHIWVDSTGAAVGAIMVTNSGGRDVVINKLAVRGQAADMATEVFADPAQDPTVDMAYDAAPADPYVAPNGLIVVPSGTTVGIYVVAPDSIGINDIGSDSSSISCIVSLVKVFSEQ